MSRIRVMIARLRAWRRRGTHDHDLDEELRGYVETMTDRHARDGMTPDAARRAALIDAGGLDQIKEDVHQARVGYGLATLWRDVRYGARVLRRAPGYALVVILTMALGIGINVTMFSVMHTVLWRALPYPDAARLVSIDADPAAVSTAFGSPDDTIDVRDARLISHAATATLANATLTAGDVMERVSAAAVSDELLPMVGAQPMELGRTLITATDVTHDIVLTGVVISHDLWQRVFHGDPHILGRHFDVNNTDVQVVGVTRPGFRVYLPAATHVDERVDMWLATGFARSRISRGGVWLARLEPGVTLAQAQTEIDALVAGGGREASGASAPVRLRLRVRPLADVITQEARPGLVALGAAVSLVLLIACVNVANLLLARAKTRERELAVRRALGATRIRLIRQLLAENLVFTGLGGAAGVLVASGGIAWLEWLRPAHLPRQSEITIDGLALLWAFGLAALSSVLFGVIPALLFTKESIGNPLSSGRSSVMRRSRRLQRGLVIAEVALSVVPLVAAGLMLRTFINLTQAPIGFEPSNVVTGTILMSFKRFGDSDARFQLDRAAVDLVSRIPGVEAVSAGGPLPFSPFQVTRQYWGDDPNVSHALVHQQTILPGYFRVLGIPLRAGRDVTNDDIAQHHAVVVIDERMAAQLWRGDAIGKRLNLERGSKTETLEVIGVAAPIRTTRVRDETSPTIYVPFHVYDIEVSLVARTREPVERIGPIIKHAVESLGTDRPFYGIQTMDAIVTGSFDDTRFTMLLLTGFAAAALLLAGIGLYGTLAYLISQRTQEFGVRLALGATTVDVVRLVLREGGALTAVGAGVGLAAALLVTRALRGLLYGVTPLDATTIAGVIGLVAVVALIAVGRPAWSAGNVDPNVALRGE